MARVTGIGGIFLRARDPKSLTAWYAQHLGIQLSDYGGATFLWSSGIQADELPDSTGSTIWSLFPEAHVPLRQTGSHPRWDHRSREREPPAS